MWEQNLTARKKVDDAFHLNFQRLARETCPRGCEKNSQVKAFGLTFRSNRTNAVARLYKVSSCIMTQTGLRLISPSPSALRI